MTQDEIIRMAREAGLYKMIQVKHVVDKVYEIPSEKLERFATLVAAHEREKQAEQEPIIWHSVWDFVDVRRDPPEKGDEANWIPLYSSPVSIESAVLAEREACAKVCDEPSYMQQRAKTSAECAAAIRARGE